MINRAFGCLPDPPDGRDFIFAASSPSKRSAVLLDRPEPLDQGQTKSCVGHGCCLWMEMTSPVAIDRRSPWFLYLLCLHMTARTGEWDQNAIRQLDNGTSIRTGFHRMASVGVCSLKSQPTDGSYEKPSLYSLLDAHDTRATVERYTRCDDVNAVDVALDQGHPVVIGLTIGDDWWSPPELLEPPAAGRGSHCVVVVGRDEDANFVIQNSWGTDWHAPSLVPGLARISREYLGKARDMWTGTMVRR